MSDRPAAVTQIGIDVGGTFTDAVSITGVSGQVRRSKVLTTPDDPAAGALLALADIVNDTANGDQLEILHATTIATNAVLERTGGPLAFIVTEGFRDILEIGRMVRSDLYNLQISKAEPLVSRRHCYEVRERIGADGTILLPIDVSDITKAVQSASEAGIGSFAVCLLHSYRNPYHEEVVKEVILNEFPAATVTLSSEVAPEIREYWRASTAVVNAYLTPVAGSYLSRMRAGIAEVHDGAPLFLMRSSGGLMSVDEAERFPVYMVESGPAAGVGAASRFGALGGVTDAISFDMGGTTAKAGIVLDGRPRVVSEFEVGASHGSGRMVKGSGYPVLGSVVDVVEVGAGGGSIAWVDEGGALRVGPRSAGASPGPAAYGMGAGIPTVTDANLTLGRLSADFFLGGAMQLDTEAAEFALSTCGAQIGLSTKEFALGVIDIVNARMAQAIRLITVERGIDPRGMPLIAFGGAGPLHANDLAEQLQVPEVIIPPFPGVASASGLLLSQIRYDFRTSHLESLDEVNADQLLAKFDGLEQRARMALADHAMSDLQITRGLGLRYKGQSWRLNIDFDLNSHDDAIQSHMLRERFDAAHRSEYGYSVNGEPIEIADLYVVALAAMNREVQLRIRHSENGGGDMQKGSRRVHFKSHGEVQVPVYDRYSIPPEHAVRGPAIIEETDSTTLVHPDFVATHDEFGLLRLRHVTS